MCRVVIVFSLGFLFILLYFQVTLVFRSGFLVFLFSLSKRRRNRRRKRPVRVRDKGYIKEMVHFASYICSYLVFIDVGYLLLLYIL